MPRGRTGVVPVSVPVRYAEQGFAGDGVQRPLRSRFPPRLKPGVGRQDSATYAFDRKQSYDVSEGKSWVSLVSSKPSRSIP
jgi:hypothetical protein